MRNVLSMELKRAFRNKYFLMVVILGCALALMAFFSSPAWMLSKSWIRYAAGDDTVVAMFSKLDCMDTVLEIWMPRYGFSNKFYYILMTIMPILCAIPYGASYLNDKKTGLVNQLIIRMKKRQYYFAKLLVTFVSGGTIACIPLIFNLMICMCFLPWGVPVRSTNLYPIGGSELFAELFYTNPVIYVIIYIIYTFVVFGLLNCACLFFVYLEENRFALLLTPFVLYFASHVFVTFGLNRAELSLMINSSMYMLYSENAWIVLLELMVIVIASLMYMFRIKEDVL